LRILPFIFLSFIIACYVCGADTRLSGNSLTAPRNRQTGLAAFAAGLCREILPGNKIIISVFSRRAVPWPSLVWL
jgi:hypothetical protein